MTATPHDDRAAKGPVPEPPEVGLIRDEDLPIDLQPDETDSQDPEESK